VTNVPPTVVYGDNTSSITILDAGVTKRSRHYAIEWFLVQDRATEGELKVEWVPTEASLADFFTKKLPRARFIELRDSIMNCRDQVVANVLRCNDEPFIEFPEPYTPYPNYNEDAWMGGQPISFLLSEMVRTKRSLRRPPKRQCSMLYQHQLFHRCNRSA